MDKKLMKTLNELLTDDYLVGEFALRRHLDLFTYQGEKAKLINEITDLYEEAKERLQRTFTPHYSISPCKTHQARVTVNLWFNDHGAFVLCGYVDVALVETRFDYAITSLKEHHTLVCKNPVTLRTALMEPLWRERVMSVPTAHRLSLSKCLAVLDKEHKGYELCVVQYCDDGSFLVGMQTEAERLWIETPVEETHHE